MGKQSKAKAARRERGFKTKIRQITITGGDRATLEALGRRAKTVQLEAASQGIQMDYISSISHVLNYLTNPPKLNWAPNKEPGQCSECGEEGRLYSGNGTMAADNQPVVATDVCAKCAEGVEELAKAPKEVSTAEEVPNA
jgi:hypothetical protein